MSNRIHAAFSKGKVLSVFLTAGYPALTDTVTLCRILEDEGVGMIEIGIPFSDPIADGPVIQRSSERALRNGMTVRELFRQLELLRPSVSIPVCLMGYVNPALQYGMEEFIDRAGQVGIDGIIMPDLPFDEFQPLASRYKAAGVEPVFLVTSRTSPEAIEAYDRASRSFLYVVAAEGVTGGASAIDSERRNFFQRLTKLNVQNPAILGFGIRDRQTVADAFQVADGAIIGSAFIRALEAAASEPSGAQGTATPEAALRKTVASFVDSLRISGEVS